MKGSLPKNDRLRVGLIKQIVKVDVKAGKLTFGQKLDIGEIISNQYDEITTIIKIIEVLHGFRPSIIQMAKMNNYIIEIFDGIKQWSTAESIMLKYEPTPEEKQAGIKDLSKKIGSMGTVDALAEKYGIDPDEVLKWEYAKVFGILYTDLEKAKYQRSYQKVLEKKK